MGQNWLYRLLYPQKNKALFCSCILHLFTEKSTALTNLIPMCIPAIFISRNIQVHFLLHHDVGKDVEFRAKKKKKRFDKTIKSWTVSLMAGQLGMSHGEEGWGDLK